MTEHPPQRGILTRTGLAALALLALAGCEHAPDLTAARARAGQPVQRYDIVQSLIGKDDLVLAGTQSGAVLRSTDGGKHWERHALEGASLIGLASCPDGSYVGLDFYHRVWSADSQAKTWTAHALPDPRNPLVISCDANNRWWVAGSRATLASSADQGASWAVSNLKEDTQITTLQFVDAQHGFALGEFGTVLASKDGGASWERLPKIPEDFYPYAAWFSSASEGYASGLAGKMLSTHDGGRSWQREDNKTGAPLYHLFARGGEVWAAGANGTLARHADSTWQSVALSDATPAPLFTAAAAGQTVVVGGPGGLLRPAALAAQ